MLRLAALVAFLAPSVAHADALRTARDQPLSEVAHTVEIRIADGVATYKVRRQFANRGKVADEAGLAIDLPSGAAATGLRIRARDRWYDGELMEREKAAKLYQELTGIGAFAPKDPALLQWLWADKLYLQVFPVLPGQVSTVEYTLTVPTRYVGGRYFLSYPRIEPGEARQLAIPTVTVKPAWGDALTEIVVDGHRVAPDTPVVLAPPVREAWQTELDVGGSHVSSVIQVPSNAHTNRSFKRASIDLAITHTYKGDLNVQLVTPQGKRIPLHEQQGGGDNNLAVARVLDLPEGTIAAGAWRLIASDHAALDTGTIDRWKLTFDAANAGAPPPTRTWSPARAAPPGAHVAATNVEAFDATDTPVFIPDAPESASDAGVAAISVAPPAIDRWLTRLGRVVASPANAFARLEVDLAPRLSKIPVRPHVVFVIDASLSGGDELVKAQLATMRAYLTHVPDAQVEIIAFRRRAARVFGAFVPAADVDKKLADKLHASAFVLGNGSAIDEATRLATTVLAGRTGDKRVIVFTDELYRPALDPKAATATLDGLAPETIVHVVAPGVSPNPYRIALERDDARPLSKLATTHHGIMASLGGFPLSPATEKQLAPAVLELVRPTRIERATVTGGFTLDAPTLHEGDGIRLFLRGKAAPDRVTLSGVLWSDPVRRDIIAAPDFSRATAAFVFGLDEHHKLSNEEMMVVALAGRAVSPVTSYVAYEPGTRPSTIGLDRSGTIGHGSGSGSGYGVGSGHGAMRRKPDLGSLVDTAACVARHAPADGWSLALTVDTTKDEIVDVIFSGKPSAFEDCLIEAVWATRLDATFHLAHERFAVILGGH